MILGKIIWSYFLKIMMSNTGVLNYWVSGNWKGQLKIIMKKGNYSVL